MIRAAAALAALLLPFGACTERSSAERAAAWLCAQQRADGGWHSEHYAVLRSGQALTPFVLHALLAHGTVPDAVLQRGLGCVRRSIAADGSIGYADPDLLEYPVYATALAILVLARVGAAEDAPRIAAMAEWLAAQQLGEARGFAAGDPAYGAFGFGARGLSAGVPGHVDLVHTRFALQALAAAARLDATVRERAFAQLRTLQNDDGGFAYSPVVDAANKAGRRPDGRFASYATATADGVLALQALGVAAADPRLVAAQGWLRQHASAWRVGGIDTGAAEPWHEALCCYHAMVLAEAWPAARAELAAMLRGRQHADGRFASTLTSAMKEDDPLLATALVLRAFAAR
ncbi:MAG: hypothetical protein JNL08_00020 [Planctomycetes bacterium]|nr:hypothetical protein [Planctomycetota bacterium]